jgi:uncharacterized iron-regulated membrane protein
MRTTDTLPRRWPDRAAVWRWHFYAGLFCIPFVLWLSLTGSVYLFRPQVEALIDRPYARVATAGPRTSPAAQAAAATRAVPGSVLHRFQLPETATQAVQIVVGKGGRETRVYVHPHSLGILKTVDEDQRLMRIVLRLHGELLAGTPGSYLVELAASWTIVMILTGLFLWWPRGGGLAGVVYPRWRRTGRGFWRDLHGVTGFWVSAFALIFLLSGLPWAKNWGGYLAAARQIGQPAPVAQDWTTGHAQDVAARSAGDAGTRAMLGDHADHLGMTMDHPAGSYAPLDALVPRLAELHLPGPVLIAPPTAHGGAWTAKSDAADRPLRSELTLAPDGAILSRQTFAQRALIDRIVGYGIALHEGALFGWINQLVNLVTAMLLMLLSVSSVILWWRRRPADVLGAPPATLTAPAAWPFVVLLVVLALFLPLMGGTMLLVLMIERVALRRIPAAQAWLGLRAPAGVP